MEESVPQNLVDENKWPYDNWIYIFQKYIKDRKQDKYDVLSEVDIVFKDISIQFDLDDYEDLLTDVKQKLTPDTIVSKSDFEILLGEWINIFRDEVTSTIISDCLDIIQGRYQEAASKIEKALISTAGQPVSGIPSEKFGAFVQNIMRILEVRIVNLTTKKPKSDENVWTDEQEEEFIHDITEFAKNSEHSNIDISISEQLLIEYFKRYDTKYWFISMKIYDNSKGIDPFNDLEEENPHLNSQDNDDKVIQEIEDIDEEIEQADFNGKLEKVSLLKKIKQMHEMKARAGTQQEKNNYEMMTRGLRKQVDALDSDHNDKDQIKYEEGEGDAYSDSENNRNPVYDQKQPSDRNLSKMKESNNRHSQLDEREIEKRLEAELGEPLEIKRAKGIKEIFDFYTRQHLMIGKKATFEQIEYELSNLNMGEFMKFCKDFKIPVSKIRCAEVFKKTAQNSKEMFLEQFKETFPKLMAMRNKEQTEALEKRHKEVKKLILKRKRKLEIDTSEEQKDVPESRGTQRSIENEEIKEKETETEKENEINKDKQTLSSATLPKGKGPPLKSKPSKGGDPHGAVQKMEERELENMRDELSKLKKENVILVY